MLMNSNLNILAVDDEPLNLEIMAITLEKEGHSVECVSNSGDAIHALTDNPTKYDLILLDRMMPIMDGIECMTRIKSSDSLSHIPIVMQTAASSEAQVAEGMNLGSYYYLTKPYTREDLLSVVNRVAEDLTSGDTQDNITEDLKTEIIEEGRFSFKIKRINEAVQLSERISSWYANPERVRSSIKKLLSVSVENANLGMSAEEKFELLSKGMWDSEVVKRQELAENKDKEVNIELVETNKYVDLVVSHSSRDFYWDSFTSEDRELALALDKFDEVIINSQRQITVRVNLI